MRFLSARLEGNLGILEGTGRREMFVDFSPAHEAGLTRILLMGRNGSGKSSFVKSLHPFPKNSDDGLIVVPGTAGRKIVTLARPSGGIMTCDVKWSKAGTISCMLSIDEEIVRSTAKGNVGEYLAAVKEHLGVTPAYLRIGHVGGAVSGFLGMLATARKSYIGQFMPEMDEWSSMHRNASKRLRVLNDELKGMRVELDRIEPREELEATMARSDASYRRLSEEVSRLDTAAGSAAGTMAAISAVRSPLVAESGVSDPGELAEFNPVLGAATAAASAAAKAAADVARHVQERPALEPFASQPAAALAKAASIREVIARISGESSAATQARLGSRARLDRAITEEGTAESRAKQLEGSASQVSELKTLIAAQRATKSALLEATSRLPGAPDGLTYDQVKAATDALSSLESDVAEVRNSFSSSKDLDDAALLKFDDVAIRNIVDRVEGTLIELKQRLQNAEARVVTAESQSVFYRRFKGMHCSDSKCPFEVVVGGFVDVEKEIETKKSEIQTLSGRILSFEEHLRNLAVSRSASRSALALHGKISKHRMTYAAAGVWDRVGPLDAFASLVSSAGSASAEVLSVQKLLSAISKKRDLAEATRVLGATEERLGHINELVVARDSVLASLASAKEAVTLAREDHGQVDAEATRLAGALEGQRAALTLLEVVIALQNRAAEQEARAAVLSAISARLEANRARWESSAAEKVTLSAQSLSASEGREQSLIELQNSQTRLDRRDEYEARLAAIAGRITVSQTICDACHPARGAPVEFLRDFLDVTRTTVNELLDVAMQGDFRIGFELSDDEFRIPVYKGSGRIIRDVMESSYGQLALAKTVISLALIKQAVMGAGSYNVVCLDEIDGPLDQERNRQRFPEIIDRIVADLGIEQLFLISHNENFHAAPAGLILFPGHALDLSDQSFVGNKVILANFN
jgi:energy-coupling factor transporter ATP-binding protein EcfA2